MNLLQEPAVSTARKVSFGSEDGLVISLKEHEHMTSMRRRSEGPQVDDTLKPPNTYRSVMLCLLLLVCVKPTHLY